ncbi:MAG: MarR family transcriptional regulator [Sphingomonas sp.]|nr:MAG: MarR family transcriptional regulator [Sphingomonas sp.]
MKTSDEPSVQAYVRLVRSAEALHAGVSRGLTVEGLTASQFSAIKVLYIHGKLAQREIAQYILKSGGNITVLVDHLERERLVTRERDTTDRRVVYVSLTSAGRDLFETVYPGHLDRIREAMGGLSDEECRQLTTLLQKVSPEHVEIACGQKADGNYRFSHRHLLLKRGWGIWCHPLRKSIEDRCDGAAAEDEESSAENR